jgi:phosphate transport system substrate-binding protein
VTPSPEAIRDGTYAPLSRPVFIYVSVKAAARPEVEAFVKFYIDNAPSLVTEVGYVPLPEALYDLVRNRYAERKAGSVFANKGAQVGVTLESLLRSEQ